MALWRIVTWRLPEHCDSIDVVRQLGALMVIGLGCWLALDNGLSRTDELLLTVPTLWAMLRFAICVARWEPVTDRRR